MRERTTAIESDRSVKEAGKVVDRGFEKLKEDLKQGRIERYLEYLSFTSHFHHYSHFNQMLIFCQKPDAKLVAGYKKWQEMGYEIKMGEQGIRIIAPVFVKQTEEDAYGRLVSMEKLIGFKEVNVFDASQLNQPVTNFIEFKGKFKHDDEGKFNLVKKAIQSEKLSVIESPNLQDFSGATIKNHILLRGEMDTVDKTTSLIREWANKCLLSFGSSDEREKPPNDGWKGCVESVAFIVTEYLGLESHFSSGSIFHYSNTAETLIDNMGVIQKTAHYMINKIVKKAQWM